VNGRRLEGVAEVKLSHNDRIIFGIRQVYVFRWKQRESESSFPDDQMRPITYEFALRERLEYQPPGQDTITETPQAVKVEASGQRPQQQHQPTPSAPVP